MPYKDLEKRKEYSEEYRKNNKEKFSEYDKKYRDKNLEKERERGKKYYCINKEKLLRKRREYLSNPEIKERDRWRRIKKKYGITKEEWERIYQEQDGRCYLCQRTEKQIKKSKSKYMVVDHNHKTGDIRGILCSFCNRTVLTVIRENADFAIRLSTYLTRKPNYGIVPQKNGVEDGCCKS